MCWPRTRPAAGDALHAIKIASKDGLRELRAILNVLRQADEADPTQPAPGLAQLDALVAGATKPGCRRRVHRTGQPCRCRPRSTWRPTASSRSR